MSQHVSSSAFGGFMSTLEDYGICRTDAFPDSFSAGSPNYMGALHLNYRLRSVLRTVHRLFFFLYHTLEHRPANNTQFPEECLCEGVLALMG